MEYRQLGRSGLKVPVLCMGTCTFGPSEINRGWGDTDAQQAARMVDICLEHGMNFFDSANVYGNGTAENVLGAAIKGKRDKLLLSTKGTFRFGEDINDVGSSRQAVIRCVDASLQRLGTDYIDLYQLHAFDAMSPIEETLAALDDLVKAGKIRYIGCSNFSGWHLMKSLAHSDRHGLARYAAHQAYYSLLGREYEWELMPLALDQGVGLVAWSPLGMGRLGGAVRRGEPTPPVSRLNDEWTRTILPPVEDEFVYGVVDALDEVAAETGKSNAQVALRWVVQRPSVSTVIFGARTEKQLRENLDVVNWELTDAQMEKLSAAGAKTKTYPYWHQAHFAERNPFPCTD
jgi:aryl-alcohol dehydrogenase-like predicted oxidoreductase